MNGKTDGGLASFIQEHEDMLFPCPFCGLHAEIDNTHTPHYWAECVGCGATVGDGNDAMTRGDEPEDHKASIRGVVVAWNKRVDLKLEEE